MSNYADYRLRDDHDYLNYFFLSTMYPVGLILHSQSPEFSMNHANCTLNEINTASDYHSFVQLQFTYWTQHEGRNISSMKMLLNVERTKIASN